MSPVQEEQENVTTQFKCGGCGRTWVVRVKYEGRKDGRAEIEEGNRALLREHQAQCRSQTK